VPNRLAQMGLIEPHGRACHGRAIARAKPKASPPADTSSTRWSARAKSSASVAPAGARHEAPGRRSQVSASRPLKGLTRSQPSTGPDATAQDAAGRSARRSSRAARNPAPARATVGPWEPLPSRSRRRSPARAPARRPTRKLRMAGRRCPLTHRSSALGLVPCPTSSTTKLASSGADPQGSDARLTTESTKSPPRLPRRPSGSRLGRRRAIRACSTRSGSWWRPPRRPGPAVPISAPGKRGARASKGPVPAPASTAIRSDAQVRAETQLGHGVQQGVLLALATRSLIADLWLRRIHGPPTLGSAARRTIQRGTSGGNPGRRAFPPRPSPPLAGVTRASLRRSSVGAQSCRRSAQ
jgi:hypothetical protein